MIDAKKMKTPMHPTTYLGLDEESTKVHGNSIDRNDWITALPYNIQT